MCKLLTFFAWRNDEHEGGHVGDFSQQAKARGIKMIFYKADLSNITNAFAQKILLPINFFPSFFSLFWHETQNNYCDKVNSDFDEHIHFFSSTW